MNYFVVLIDKDEFEYCILQTKNKKYAYKVFRDLFIIPDYKIELRATKEDIDLYLNYEVLQKKEI